MSSIEATRGIVHEWHLLTNQGFAPTLIVSEFKTVVSLITSFIVILAFLTFMAYTTYVWVTAPVGGSGASRCRCSSYSLADRSVVARSQTLPTSTTNRSGCWARAGAAAAGCSQTPWRCPRSDWCCCWVRSKGALLPRIDANCDADNGTFVNLDQSASLFKVTFTQNTICNSESVREQEIVRRPSD